jgi:predicted enzyme related to lactoylglutathione lyase
MTSPRPEGSACWVDLSSPDPAASGRFYRELLGWQLVVEPTPMGEYTICMAGGEPAAGMMAPPAAAAGLPPAWSVYFAVADLDAAWTRATAAGATGIQPPMEVPGGDRIAVVMDPAGARVRLMQPAPDTAMVYGRPSTVCWVEMQTRAIEPTRAFYESVLGWVAAEGTAGYWLFEKEGEQVAGMMAMPAEVPAEVPSYWLVYFGVGDVAEATNRVTGLGGAVEAPVMQVGDQVFSVVSDPTGAVIGLLQVH